jgi:hypothetical protein
MRLDIHLLEVRITVLTTRYPMHLDFIRIGAHLQRMPLVPWLPTAFPTAGLAQTAGTSPKTPRNSSNPTTTPFEGSQTQSFIKINPESAYSKITPIQKTSTESPLAAFTDRPGSLSTFCLFKKMNHTHTSITS